MKKVFNLEFFLTALHGGGEHPVKLKGTSIY
jgi:hypothetical protein